MEWKHRELDSITRWLNDHQLRELNKVYPDLQFFASSSGLHLLGDGAFVLTLAVLIRAPGLAHEHERWTECEFSA